VSRDFKADIEKILLQVAPTVELNESAVGALNFILNGINNQILAQGIDSYIQGMGDLGKYIKVEIQRATDRPENVVFSYNKNAGADELKRTAALEYITAELLELTANVALDNDRHWATSADVADAIAGDEEFSKVLPSLIDSLEYVLIRKLLLNSDYEIEKLLDWLNEDVIGSRKPVTLNTGIYVHADDDTFPDAKWLTDAKAYDIDLLVFEPKRGKAITVDDVMMALKRFEAPFSPNRGYFYEGLDKGGNLNWGS